MAFVANSNRPQPLSRPPPTACPTASGAASRVPSLLMHPCPAVSAHTGSLRSKGGLSAPLLRIAAFWAGGRGADVLSLKGAVRSRGTQSPWDRRGRLKTRLGQGGVLPRGARSARWGCRSGPSEPNASLTERAQGTTQTPNPRVRGHDATTLPSLERTNRSESTFTAAGGG